MKRKSIIDEVFRGTLILFATLLLCQVILQRMFTDFFYIESKAKYMGNEMLSLEQALLSDRLLDDEKQEAIRLFEEKNNAVTMITHANGQPLYNSQDALTAAYLLIKTTDEKTYRIYIQDQEKATQIFNQIQIGSRVACTTTIYEDTTSLFPESIVIDNNQTYYVWGITQDVMSIKNLTNRLQQKERKGEEKEINGEIIKLVQGAPQQEQGKIETHRNTLLEMQVLRFQLEYEWYEAIISNQLIYFLTSDNQYKMDNIFFAKQMMDERIIFVMIPLQSVSEAAVILKNLYGYLFVIAVLLTAVASYFYSRMLTKPLLNMNSVAQKIANLDFSEKCVVHSNDELGDLAQSINTMSINLEKYMEKLENTNRDLKRDIVEERKQEELRRELVANISHEFKTPLTVIKGTVEGIKDGVYQSDEATLQSIIDEASRLNRMVFDLLELSRIESHNYTIQLEAFDLWESVLRVNNTMKVMAKQKNMSVHVNGEECPVIGDESKVEQVIRNLYSNAIRYSGNNEAIIINVSMSQQAAHFSIVNTGVTIPVDELDNVWEGFYRVEKSRNRASGGTGLGLLIVKRILELHNSHYGVKNLTNGVEFYFDLKKYQDREKTKLEQADEALQNIASSVKHLTGNLLKNK